MKFPEESALNNFGEYLIQGVDAISIGGLTHSVKSIDISMEIESFPMNAFDVADFQHHRKSKFGSEIFYYDEVDSTNRIAESLAKQNHREGTLILANSQSSGRGRNTNQWYSPKGVNLYSTLLLKPVREDLHRIPFIAGLAVSRAVIRIQFER